MYLPKRQQERGARVEGGDPTESQCRQEPVSEAQNGESEGNGVFLRVKRRRTDSPVDCLGCYFLSLLMVKW
jgi:hypothetical protein